MDIHYDEAWCPVCDRQIMPKRYTVPVPPPVATDQQNAKPTAKTIRPRGGGLLQGTGRVKPNGALKRTDSSGSRPRTTSPHQEAPQPAKLACPPKVRTVIDQGPIPLYCSDECRMADLSRRAGAYPIDYNPDRASPPLPPVPHNSFVGSPLCESEDDSTTASGSSLESHSSSSESDSLSPSMATLAAIYGFSLPRAQPIASNPTRFPPHREPYYHDYQTGVMMAAKRIEAALCSLPDKRPSNKEARKQRKVIPGWTDGSDAWREDVYCFSLRSSRPTSEDEFKTSFAASSHRGVQWTSSNSSSSLPTYSSSDHPLPRSSQSYTEKLYEKYQPGSSRCGTATTNINTSASTTTSSTPPLAPFSLTTRTSRRRENPLAKVEGRLLVPHGALGKHSSSSQSVSSAGLSSPLSRYPSQLSEGSMWEYQRSPQEGRSWSYDNVRTYPVMTLSKTEERMEDRVVDGKQVKVKVQVPAPMKRLFLFEGKGKPLAGDGEQRDDCLGESFIPRIPACGSTKVRTALA